MADLVDNDRATLLYELGCAFASQLELDELIATIIARCREVLNAEGAAILLHDPATDELYFPYVAESDPGVAERLTNVRFPADNGIAGAVLHGGRCLVVADAANDPRFYPEVDRVTGLTTRSLLSAPLHSHDGTIGVIQVVNRIGAPAFTAADLELLDSLAGAIGIAIDNSRMFAALKEKEQRLLSEVGALRRDLARQDRFGELVGTSQAMAEVFRLMESAAASPIAVLIEGETGTGKELVARGIHRASDRANAAFVAINCAALPADLLEAELFGHARGAFTGATADRRGLFETAHEGTIFLDELGDLPLAMQVKLLRVLQDGEITPVGTSKVRKVDVRVLSATNRDLRAAVAEGSFRGDLFYRISAFPIHVPPLRERSEDIPLLVDRFVQKAAERHRKIISGVDADVFGALCACAWPGNVRQLENEIERAVALTPAGEQIRASVLSSDLGSSAAVPSAAMGAKAAQPAAGAEVPGASSSLKDARTAFEARFIAEQLRRHDGNVSRTAEALGISRVMLQKKMKAYGLR